MNVNCIYTGEVVSTLSLAILFSFSSVSITNAASIVADSQAPIEQQANIKVESTPWPSVVPCRSVKGCGHRVDVNITAPDGNGLSHNKFTQFDAPHFSDTIVLNNILSKENNGNPNLAGAAAKIILNEVRSPQKSLLNGTVTLSGQDAHVIIANPSGIDCNGCSFNNISHLTLTTGGAYFSHNNKLQGFEVQGGQININKGEFNSLGFSHKGKNKGSAYLDLFTDSLKIKGDIFADDLFVIAGKKIIRLASPGERMGISSLVSHLSPPDNIDSVKVMGGMYANKIRIITEGNIINRNYIQSASALQMVAGANIDNRLGSITAGAMLLYSGGVINNIDGKIKVSKSNDNSAVDIVAGSLINNRGKIYSHGKNIKIRVDKPIENHKGEIAIFGNKNKKQLKI
ncbi:filamentous hemagglutinin N-terminal domain-containing protein [Yersinia hibernica]|uniref:Filamentous hemagglutinin N-terminal domain-containing protein n=1 Tax=Yersinia hibernica TaxID=2339259 RepID=A0ABX5R660_9GAMM|nr:filamentous hemagglutinin N-terminal domain-containing protein [Yersinia hibernica]QAX80896.1 filamentous hemagglutinin N-terminal domain-containing protein [Yersinia hibernica]